ncbi:MAG: hypothetical protein ACKOZN_08105, partial [Cyanobium sp.]
MADRLPPPAGIQRHHQRTLAALFAHPLHRDLRTSQVEALLRSLGASVTPLDGRRLRIQMPGGEETWIHTSCGLCRPQMLLNHLHSHHRPLLDRIVGVAVLQQAAEPLAAAVAAVAHQHQGAAGQVGLTDPGQGHV